MQAVLSNRVRLAFLGGILLAFSVTGTLAQSDDHDHHHHHHAAGAELELQLDNGERWLTDESLRGGMQSIRRHFDAAHGAYRAGQLDRQSAAALAEQVDEQVQYIFAHCNLPAAADAELHKLLAATLGATRTLRESDNVHDGLHALHGVLESYGEYFDHPGWPDEVAH
jgi:hypothetical protein